MTNYSNFQGVEAHLDALGLFHMDLGLARMERFAAAWGGSLPVVHVVGTNGKGSTAAFFERIARNHGLITGLHTSPHFLTPRERIRIGGSMLSEKEWVRLANGLRGLGMLELTYFEWLTAFSALAFEDAGVDVAIMEAGMGGRFDATRVFAPSLTLLTPVGLDHEKYLGSSLMAIAEDKSRAIRPRSMAVTVPQEPEVMAVYKRRAADVGARLLVAEPVAGMSVKRTTGMRLGLAGSYQTVNAGLALAGWRAWCGQAGLEVDEHACIEGLAQTRLPGRFQVVPAGLVPAGSILGDEKLPALILDGAHNGHGLRALRKALQEAAVTPAATIFCCMRDKDLAEMRREVLALGPGPVFVPEIEAGDRAMPAKELAQMLGERAVAVENMAEALACAGAAAVAGGDAATGVKPVMVCGSLYGLAELYKLYPHLMTGADMPDATIRSRD